VNKVDKVKDILKRIDNLNDVLTNGIKVAYLEYSNYPSICAPHNEIPELDTIIEEKIRKLTNELNDLIGK
jgi:hypothetical protein